jgi:hypothetical protein
VTIDDHEAVRDSHRTDDRGDQSRKGTPTSFSPCAPTTRLPGGSTSPLSFRKRELIRPGRLALHE